VVVKPNVPTSLRRQQQEVDRTKTEALEAELARRRVEGAPAGGPREEISILTAGPSPRPSSSPPLRSLEELDAELATVQARTEALKRELEELRQRSPAK
jgi:hypothetical protein